MGSETDSRAQNATLDTFYATKLDAWKELFVQQRGLGRNLSIPLFLEAFPEYLAARPRIVFVGQETHGWWTEYDGDHLALTVREIGDFYGCMWGRLYEDYRRSPYWQAMRYIAKGLEVSDKWSFLFGNLFPCDVNRGRAPESVLETMRTWKILPYELSVLDPDYVIFFCGPVYSYNLGYYFGREVSPSSFSHQNPWQRYEPPDHRWKGFLTYHPNHLKRSKNWHVLDGIIESIRSDTAANAHAADVDQQERP